MSRTLVHGGLFLAGAALFAILAGGFQFGGYDLSPVVDASWRLARGEIPGVDFINTFPALFLMLLKLSGLLFDSYAGLMLTNVMFTILCSGALVVLMRQQGLPEHYLFSLMALLCVPMLYTGHVWHSAISSVSAALYCLALLPVIRGQRLDSGKLVTVFLLALLVALGKQNVALPLLAFSVVYLLIFDSEGRWNVLTAVIMGVFAAFILSYALLGLDIDAWIYLYTAVLGRARPPTELWSDTLRMGSGVVAIAIVAIGVFAFVSTLSAKKSPVSRRQSIGLWGLLAVALIPLMTDWDAKLNNMPFFLMAALLPVLVLPEKINQGLIRVARLSISILVVVAVLGGWTRERMRAVGPFYEASNSYPIRGYFEGLKTGPWFAVVTDEMSRAVNLVEGRPVFFGPRLEFGYRYVNLRSPSKMPLWWHPGSSYSLLDQEKIVRQFVDLNFKLLVFSKGDRTRMPPELVYWIEQNYERVEGFQAIDVYRIKIAV